MYTPGDGEPLLNRDAFERVESFNFYTGVGPRVSNVRLYPYTNTNLSLYKTTRIAEKVRFELRFEFFNLWNQHIFTASGQFGSSAFENDIAEPRTSAFGMASVTDPRQYPGRSPAGVLEGTNPGPVGTERPEPDSGNPVCVADGSRV